VRNREEICSLALVLGSIILFLISISSTASAANAASENLTVHFIDVEQGDSILLILGDNNSMLIDAGERDKGDDVVKYLKSEGITSLDYVVATHPHSDHIGGMSVILNSIPVNHFIDSGYPATSKTYENMLSTIDSKNIPFTVVKRGDKIDFAPGINVQVLNPGSFYFNDDVNQNSVVLKVTDGSVSFLFMGDAGIEAEKAIMQDGNDVNADILKIGHHGSRTASGASFISAVSPAVSIIEVGANNEYGHPHPETLRTLQKASTVYRTDTDGTVTVTTDGMSYSVSTENTALNSEGTMLPRADFSSSPTTGYAPLSVQFTDLSKNTVSRNWDLYNDGVVDSSKANPVYTYASPGNYTVNLTVSNAYGTDSKTAIINVLEEGNSGGLRNGAVTESQSKPNIGSEQKKRSTAANVERTTEQKENTPGFEIIYAIIGLLAVFLYREI
jgi:beta-lactamase superfamily II metal-dependent hydrolase